MTSGEQVLALCAEAGFQRAVLLPSHRLPPELSEHPQLTPLGEGTYVLCALSCYRREPDDLSGPGNPQGLIAPFARRHYYREAVLRLKKVAARLAASLRLADCIRMDRDRLRIFSNSGLPEKALAAAGGLGCYGKNSLILAPGLGSLFVIAGLFLPLTTLAPAPLPRLEPGEVCGACSACLQSCPTGAIVEPGRVDPGLCLQGLASRAGAFSDGFRLLWGTRFYGCQACQEVCPHNQYLSLETETSLGELGPSLPLPALLERPGPEFKIPFRRTALGLSWVEPAALRRNALLAAGNHRNPALLPQLRPWLESPDPVLAGAAAWAISRCGG